MSTELPPLPADWMWDESFIYDAEGDAIPAADYVRAYGLQCRKAALLEAAELVKSKPGCGCESCARVADARDELADMLRAKVKEQK